MTAISLEKKAKWICSVFFILMGIPVYFFFSDALFTPLDYIEKFENSISQEFSVKQLHLHQTREKLKREFWQKLSPQYPAPVAIRADLSTLRLIYRDDQPILLEDLTGIEGHFLERKEGEQEANWKLFQTKSAIINYEKKLFESDLVDLQFVPAVMDPSKKSYIHPRSSDPTLLKGRAKSLSIDFKQTPALLKISNFRAEISEEGKEKWIRPTAVSDEERQ